jgi:hypothetical protein
MNNVTYYLNGPLGVISCALLSKSCLDIIILDTCRILLTRQLNYFKESTLKNYKQTTLH